MILRHDMIECFVVRPVGASHEFLQIRRGSGQYLQGLWHTVAGKIEPGETAVQAVLRELGEETGLQPHELYSLDRIGSFYMPAIDTLWHCVLFCAVVAPDDPVHINDEHDAFRWISANEADRMFAWPSDRESVRQIVQEICNNGPAKAFMRVAL